MMARLKLSAALAAILGLCACAETNPNLRQHFVAGGGGGASAPDMERLRSVELDEGETLRPDDTLNDSGQQGTDGGNNSSDQDEPGRPDKNSG